MKITFRQAGRALLLIGAGATAVILIRAWREQANAPLHCSAAFGRLAEHNGYIQVDLVRQHPTEQYFDAEVFVMYATSESPPEEMRLTLDASGSYATTVADTKLVPFGDGRATQKPINFGLSTPNVSQKLFPFDSPAFDLTLHFEPSRRPQVVIFRNRTPDFIPACDTFLSQWSDPDKLRIQVHFRRNPFVQATVVIIGLAALGFGVFLGLIQEIEDLTMATASYFFSLWSIRGIVAPASVSYPTLLDFWLMAVSVVVLFLVAWRLLARDVRSRGS